MFPLTLLTYPSTCACATPSSVGEFYFYFQGLPGMGTSGNLWMPGWFGGITVGGRGTSELWAWIVMDWLFNGLAAWGGKDVCV